MFRSEDVPAPDRFDRWRELMRRCTVPLELDSDSREDFRASQRLLEFDGISVWPTSFQPVSFRRTPRLIRQEDPEQVNISIPLRGTLFATRGGHGAEYGPRTLCVVDSARPIEVRTRSRQIGIGLDVPKALLPLRGDALDQLSRSTLSGREGFGSLLVTFLTQLARDTSVYRPSDGPRLASIVVDLLSALFTHHLGTGHDLGPETRRRTLLLEIQAFIRRHADDPDLTPAAVAAAHHISASHLHRLFRDEDTTVAATIRRLRLEGARRDLADAARHGARVQDIAARWGFGSHASFTRAFRDAYGLSPRDYRHQAVDGSGARGADGT
ncbi:AraC-like ligand-binding domain-containing protein [Streptomyces zingiberis]|uniref:AraC-like ligand-binding domain-containing protein n=1 Tax=Streptomyces zingiberis TaxID=2053010 RepID=UPI0028935C93|nr:helix-turn-helix domain-containing protein [Streptomyces zingiberis]